MIVLTDDLIKAGMDNGRWNKRQLLLLGVPWPPLSGWKARAIGNRITEEAYREFVSLAGLRKADYESGSLFE